MNFSRTPELQHIPSIRHPKQMAVLSPPTGEATSTLQHFLNGLTHTLPKTCYTPVVSLETTPKLSKVMAPSTWVVLTPLHWWFLKTWRQFCLPRPPRAPRVPRVPQEPLPLGFIRRSPMLPHLRTFLGQVRSHQAGTWVQHPRCSFWDPLPLLFPLLWFKVANRTPGLILGHNSVCFQFGYLLFSTFLICRV